MYSSVVFYGTYCSALHNKSQPSPGDAILCRRDFFSCPARPAHPPLPALLPSLSATLLPHSSQRGQGRLEDAVEDRVELDIVGRHLHLLGAEVEFAVPAVVV